VLPLFSPSRGEDASGSGQVSVTNHQEEPEIPSHAIGNHPSIVEQDSHAHKPSEHVLRLAVGHPDSQGFGKRPSIGFSPKRGSMIQDDLDARAIPPGPIPYGAWTGTIETGGEDEQAEGETGQQ
jgi:hypothetical protein